MHRLGVFAVALAFSAAAAPTKPPKSTQPAQPPPAASVPEAAPTPPPPAEPVAPAAAAPESPSSAPEPQPIPAPAPSQRTAPASPAPVVGDKPSLVVLELTAGGGVDRDTAQSMTEAVAAQATRSGIFQVTAQKDLTTLLSLERQKQLLGCAEESASCMAEMAGALGARFVLSGNLSKLGGDTWQLTLQMQDTTAARSVGRSTRIAGDLKALRSAVPWAFAEATATPAPPVPSKALPITLMATGGAAIAGGGVMLILSLQREEAAVRELELSASQPQVQIKDAAYYQAEADVVRTMRIVGGILTGVGAAALVTGIVLLSTSDAGDTRLALVPAPGGLGIVGVFP